MNDNNLDQIVDVLHKHADSIQNAYNIKNLGIFGSVARKESSKASDVDILVELSQPIGLFKFLKLESFLSRILKRKVDLVTIKALKPAIKQKVLSEIIYV